MTLKGIIIVLAMTISATVAAQSDRLAASQMPSNDSIVAAPMSRKDSIKAARYPKAVPLRIQSDSVKRAKRPDVLMVADSVKRAKRPDVLMVADSVKAMNEALYAEDMKRVMQMDSLAKANNAHVDSLTTAAGKVAADSLAKVDSIVAEGITSILADTIAVQEQPRNWSSWRPDPQKALWLALVIPGGGQIYNRKYWKLPLIYGGIVGCIYAMSWNNMMYKDYSQAYLDIMDSDPNTQSYNQFLHLGKQIDASNEERYKQIFKSRKDKYRRWRDLSFFCLIGVYAISVIDAYVDAELSQFDISDDLSLQVQPTVVGATPQGGFQGDASLGVNCTLNF